MKPQERARHLRPLIERAAVSLPDEDALEAIELFPAYKIGHDYKTGDRFHDGEDLYRVEQDHVSQADWIPSELPALYTKVALPGEILVWKRPTGVQDAYDYGDKVYYPTENDDIYQSIYDGKNSWSPDEYPAGWMKLT